MKVPLRGPRNSEIKKAAVHANGRGYCAFEFVRQDYCTYYSTSRTNPKHLTQVLNSRIVLLIRLSLAQKHGGSASVTVGRHLRTGVVDTPLHRVIAFYARWEAW